jgi:uncharacterized membrane protein YhaH (DUF805 family)
MEDGEFASLDPPAAQAALSEVADEAEQRRLRHFYARTNGFLVDGTGWTPARRQPASKPLGWLQGRMNRVRYWLALAAIAAVYAAFVALPHSGNISISEGVLVALAIPRLHDLGLSGWIAAGAFGVEIVCAILVFVALPVGLAAEAMGVVALVIAALLVTLGSIPGQKAENRFGAPPRPGIGLGQKADSQAAAHFD